MKTGWLLKKRDIISGWKCRYFEVHLDRLDYFESPDDPRPRGSYLLQHVEVSSVKPIRTKRKSEHYGLLYVVSLLSLCCCLCCLCCLSV